MKTRPTSKGLRYEDRCRIRQELLEKAAAEVVTICSRFSDVRAVYAYGSYARGTVGPTSDLDILIVRETTLPRFQREDDIRLHLRTPVGFDLLVVRPEEFTDTMPANSVGSRILAEAKLLYAI
jgi:predicted nucleotidyltransferase